MWVTPDEFESGIVRLGRDDGLPTVNVHIMSFEAFNRDIHIRLLHFIHNYGEYYEEEDFLF